MFMGWRRLFGPAIAGLALMLLALNADDAIASYSGGVDHRSGGDGGAIAPDPDDADSYYNRGNAYSDTGDYGRAIKNYDRAIALDPDYAKAYYNRGISYYHKADYGRAIKDFDGAIALDPKRAKYLGSRCWARAVAGTDLDLARADCDAALALSGNEPGTLDSRGLVGLKQGLFDRAWADYDAALRAAPGNAGFLYGRGIAALGEGRTADGRDDLAAAMKLDGRIAATYAGYGVPPR